MMRCGTEEWSGVRSQGEDCVEASEGQGVAEGQFGPGFAGLVEDDVEVEGRVDLGDACVGG